MSTIRIKQKIADALVGHALRHAPIEGCGYLGGVAGVISAFYPMTNADNSPEHFSFDPGEQFDTVRLMRSKGHKPLAVYHSHPATPARPSEEDIRLAYDPDMSWFILSLAEMQPVLKSFRIRNGVATEENIEIV